MKPEPLIRKGFSYETFRKESMFQVEKEFFHISDIKSACEFYLRYKDRPDLFEKEQKDLIDYDTWDFRHHTFVILKGNRASEYNLWLFKLAFKDVLEKGDNQ